MSRENPDAGHPLFSHPVIPLASFADEAHIDAAGDGLVAGGLPVVEVALRGDLGLTAIERLSGRGDLLVGAGTVLSPEQAREALDAGASFVVTPGFDQDVVRFVQEAGVPIVPGVLTPSEVQAALRLGLRRLKLFPSGAVDARKLLGAYRDVFRDVRFMPSGGVSAANMTEFLALANVFAVSGSWIVGAASEGADAVARLAAEAVATAGAGEAS